MFRHTHARCGCSLGEPRSCDEQSYIVALEELAVGSSPSVIVKRASNLSLWWFMQTSLKMEIYMLTKCEFKVITDS